MRKQALATYECDLSGLSAPALEEDAGDDLADLPIGWSVITISTRVPNPNFSILMQAKDAAEEATLAQAGVTEIDEDDAAIVALMTDAQFAPLLQNITPFLIEDTELYVHPEYLSEVITALGLDGEVELVDTSAALGMGTVESLPEPQEEEDDSDDDSEVEDEGSTEAKAEAVAG